MPIHITKTPDVYLTPSQLKAYRYEYQRAFSMYCGPTPDFEEWVASQEAQKRARRAELRAQAQKVEDANEQKQ